MESHTSISGQVLALYDAGYSAKEVLAEMKTRPGCGKLSLSRVQQVIRQATARGADSRRLFEVWEMTAECVALLRELVGEKRARAAASRMRGLEKRGLAEMLGAAIDRATEPGSAGNSLP